MIRGMIRKPFFLIQEALLIEFFSHRQPTTIATQWQQWLDLPGDLAVEEGERERVSEMGGWMDGWVDRLLFDGFLV